MVINVALGPGASKTTNARGQEPETQHEEQRETDRLREGEESHRGDVRHVEKNAHMDEVEVSDLHVRRRQTRRAVRVSQPTVLSLLALSI